VSSSSEGQWLCAGRFAFRAPDSMRVVGRTASMYRTNVDVIPMTQGGIDGYWSARLAAIALTQPLVPRRVALSGGTLGVWYRSNRAFPNVLTLEVAKPLDRAIVVATREGEAGKEAVGEELAADIVNAYVPNAERGFCVGGGSIVLEPSQNEHARIALETPSEPAIEIRVETQTVREPETTAYANTDEDEEIARRHGGTLTSLRDAQRVIANMPGKELWVSAAVPGEPPMLRYSWHHPGESGSSARPSVTVVGSARTSQRAALEAAWEAILGSMRAIPLPPAERK
jgi:hypothetical protein